MSHSTYQPEIDGLRALAVLMVLAYHFSPEFIPGGFVGVDVFFVISGHLITRLIKNEILSTGDFRFGRFYLRRARRLFPALAVTVTLTMAVSVFLLSPMDLKRLAGSAISAVLSGSNFFFWSEAGYFDSGATVKPLLHTWSLSVEEQFYLVWPLLILAIYRWAPSMAIYIVLIVATASLVSSEYLLVSLPSGDMGTPEQGFSRASAAFFLPPFRAFEFAVGAFLAVSRFTDHGKWKWRWIADALFLLGLCMILYAGFGFSEETRFPTYNALVPCLGTGLLLLSVPQSRLRPILDNRVMVFLGLISYSLYLIHWPIIVLSKYYLLVNDFSVNQLGGLWFVSITFSVLLYYLVERPLRRPRPSVNGSNLRFVFGASLAAMILVFACVNIWLKEGWKWRVPEEIAMSGDEMLAMREQYWGEWRGNVVSPDSFSANKLSVVVIGNSYGLDVVNILRVAGDAEVYYEGTTGNCSAFIVDRNKKGSNKWPCAENFERFKRNYGDANFIILAENGSTWSPSRLRPKEISSILKELSENNTAQIVVFGVRPRYSSSPHQVLSRRGTLAFADKLLQPFLREKVQRMLSSEEEAKSWYADYDVAYYSPVGFLCDEDSCDVLTNTGKLIYFDRGHFSYSGVAYLSDDFLRFLAQHMNPTD